MQVDKNEIRWDRLLPIRTMGRGDSNERIYEKAIQNKETYLIAVDELLFLDEIDCRDLFPGNNPREKIVIFEL